MTAHPNNLEFYYRVDSHARLREIKSDDLFRPKRWPHDGSGWKHVDLINAAKNISGNEAIYRISFWENENEARTDLSARGFVSPHIMLRVSRALVARTLDGWTFGDDDYLSKRAALIWQRMSKNGENFCFQGIPLEQFDIWESNGWRPWTEAVSVQPDQVRMARVGWQPLSVVTRQGPVVAYWCLVQSGPQTVGSPWVLLTLDDSSPGNLGGEVGAVNQAANLLLTGQLRMVAPYIAGILTVHAGEDQLWTQQYVVSHNEEPSPSIFSRILHYSDPKKAWKVELSNLITKNQEQALIKRSCLRAARSERRSSIW